MENMLGKLTLAEYQGLRDELEGRLAGLNSEKWLAEFKRFLRKNSCWIKTSALKLKLFKFVTTVSVPAIEYFVAKDHFKIDTSAEASVKIVWLGDNFTEHFLGKFEGASEAAELKLYKLLESSLDLPIIAELGDKSNITLGQFCAMLSKQATGKCGGPALVVSGGANVAYIRDKNRVLWAVRAYWPTVGGGWELEAYSIGIPDLWHAGCRFVSR